jgi:ankyrin repeat protein
VLFVFFSKGDVDAVKILLDAGCNPNALNELGQSPLHIAAKEGHWNVVQELIKKPDTSLVGVIHVKGVNRGSSRNPILVW